MSSASENDYTADPWAAWKESIRNELNRLRPDRYDAGDKEWMEPVIGLAAQTMPNQYKAVRVHAESVVSNLDGGATRAANQEILKWADGHKPLFWHELGALPFSCGKLRIRLDAGTPDDYEQAAYEQRASAKSTYDRTLFRATALEELASTARHRGLTIVSGIGDLPIRQTPEGHQFTEDDLGDDEDF
jgi:hypothetical protein